MANEDEVFPEATPETHEVQAEAGVTAPVTETTEEQEVPAATVEEGGGEADTVVSSEAEEAATADDVAVISAEAEEGEGTATEESGTEAEEGEEETVEEVDYSTLSTEELIEAAEGLAQSNDFRKAEQAFREVRDIINKQRKEAINTAREAFLADGGNAEDFEYKGNALFKPF